MSTNRSGSNKRLREKIEVYLQKHKSLDISTFILTISQKYYAVTPQRIGALIRERTDVKRIRTGLWVLCE